MCCPSRCRSTRKQLRIFYGSGNAQGANALEVRDGRIELVRRNVDGAQPFTPEAAARIFQSIRARPGSRNLLVLVGSWQSGWRGHVGQSRCHFRPARCANCTSTAAATMCWSAATALAASWRAR